MKKLNFLHKFLYWLNVLVALLLAISFVLPYLPPKTFSSITLLSLVVSPLIVLNILFAVYWLLRLRKKFWLSFIVLFISHFHFSPFYEFSSEGDPQEYSNTLKILTHNVRLFNAYEKDKTDMEATDFLSMIKEQDPDVICIQEYYKKTQLEFSEYPYQYVHFRNDKISLGHAILSKYPIANQGAFDYKDSNNNTLFADIVKEQDTIRIYNLHLQSLGILPTVSFLQEGDSDRIRNKMTTTFKKQQEQVAQILEHKKQTNHPSVLAGDFNNTPYSYTYHTLCKGTTDAFVAKGSGLGTTFKFDGYPMRIDYVLASPELDVISFKTDNATFSDHYPLTTVVGW